MNKSKLIAVAVFAGVASLLVHLSAQAAGVRAADKQRELATFPAQQRPPGNPLLIARGKKLYTVSCLACHGVDLRGGDLGGPNLLRSQVVLSDRDGELILPIVKGARAGSGMPAIRMTTADVKATATYIHSVVAKSRGQGAPPSEGVPVASILVGNAAAGRKYFDDKCSGCHSATGDLRGIAERYPDPKTLQNRWVSGGGGGRMSTNDPRTVMVTVTGPAGEVTEGRLIRIDDFLVTVADSSGDEHTFRRDGDIPKVEVKDPMQAHRDLLGVYTDQNMHDVTAYLVTLK